MAQFKSICVSAGCIAPLSFAALAAALPAFASASSLDVYLSAPGQQSTYVSGASTETFNTLPAGLQTSPFHSAIGVYQFSPGSPMAAVAADQYGGAERQPQRLYRLGRTEWRLGVR